eukprot:1158635-Pelagomonas_calceolata.AAC.2
MGGLFVCPSLQSNIHCLLSYHRVPCYQTAQDFLKKLAKGGSRELAAAAAKAAAAKAARAAAVRQGPVDAAVANAGMDRGAAADVIDSVQSSRLKALQGASSEQPSVDDIEDLAPGGLIMAQASVLEMSTQKAAAPSEVPNERARAAAQPQQQGKRARPVLKVAYGSEDKLVEHRAAAGDASTVDAPASQGSGLGPDQEGQPTADMPAAGATSPAAHTASGHLGAPGEHAASRSQGHPSSNLDLEWMREATDEEASDYLLSVEGLGSKSAGWVDEAPHMGGSASHTWWEWVHGCMGPCCCPTQKDEIAPGCGVVSNNDGGGRRSCLLVFEIRWMGNWLLMVEERVIVEVRIRDSGCMFETLNSLQTLSSVTSRSVARSVLWKIAQATAKLQ